MEIASSTIISCQWCGVPSTLQEWDDISYKDCTSREMRRAYMHLSNERAFNKKYNKFYKCPNCGKWLKGCQLMVRSSDKNIASLGNEPVIDLSQVESVEEVLDEV